MGWGEKFLCGEDEGVLAGPDSRGTLVRLQGAVGVMSKDEPMLVDGNEVTDSGETGQNTASGNRESGGSEPVHNNSEAQGSNAAVSCCWSPSCSDLTVVLELASSVFTLT